MAKKKSTKIVTPKMTGPTIPELELRIAALESRIDKLVDAISRAKKVKGL